MSRLRMSVLVLDSVEPFSVELCGRDAWALQSLVRAGEGGCTPIDHPGPRWSHYVWKLRRAGIAIETIDEAHGGIFASYHARYVLRSRVQVVVAEDAVEAA